MRWRPVLQVTVDLLAIAVGLTTAYAIVAPLARLAVDASGRACVECATLALPAWIAIFRRCRLYDLRVIADRWSELTRILEGVPLGILAMATLSFLLRLPVARSWLGVSGVLVTLSSAIGRQTLAWVLARAGDPRFAGGVVLVAGGNAEAQRLYNRLTRDRRLGYLVAGLLVESDDSVVFDGPPVLGTVASGLEVARRTGATGIVVATTALSEAAVAAMVSELTEHGYHVELSCPVGEVVAGRLSVQPLGWSPMLRVDPVPRRGGRVAAKRVFDVVVAGLSLVVLCPVFVVIALVVKLDTRGPVFFRQLRVGRDGRLFRVIKFRSMVAEAEDLLADLRDRNDADGPLFKLRCDPRVTRSGSWLRRYSLDELPQLVNVIRGHMSIVGPRPALAAEAQAWTEELRRAKLRVRPGLTGIWQVSGRSDLSFEDYVRFDVYYVQNWSLLRDLAIVVRTVPALITRRGAY